MQVHGDGSVTLTATEWRALNNPLSNIPSEALQRRPDVCHHIHAGTLPGLVGAHSDGDYFCADCGADMGVSQCQGCCVQRFGGDILEEFECDIGGDVDHGCCYHDERASNRPDSDRDGSVSGKVDA